MNEEDQCVLITIYDDGGAGDDTDGVSSSRVREIHNDDLEEEV